ncbi:MAG: response regulator transcription factor [Nevskia sp.]|nr:response regulator transcription factor [Nevskia sp.]
MADDPETVFIIDDEEPVRRSLRYLLESVKLRVEAFDSAEAFLSARNASACGCIVLDVRMPGISGPELMDRLNRGGPSIPIIFLSAHGDVPLAVRAMRGGAIDFLQKPPNSQVFLECVRRALEHSRRTRDERAEAAAVDQRLATLTAREREVLEGLIAGRSNKVIARQLEISYKTVEAHRGRLMRKMAASNYAELVNMIVVKRRGTGASL